MFRKIKVNIKKIILIVIIARIEGSKVFYLFIKLDIIKSLLYI